MKQLVFIPPTNYNETVLAEIQKIAADGKRVYYVTLNKTCANLRESLQEVLGKAEQFTFLDAITPKLLTLKSQEHCEYVSSVDDINELTEKILTGVLASKSQVLVIDSLSSLLVYKDEKEVLAFLNYLLPFMDRKQMSVVLFTLQEDAARPALKQLQMMMDHTRVAAPAGASGPKPAKRSWLR